MSMFECAIVQLLAMLTLRSVYPHWPSEAVVFVGLIVMLIWHGLAFLRKR